MNQTRPRLAWGLAGVVALTLLAAACGGGGGGGGSDDGATETSVTPTTTEFVQHRFHELLANGMRNRMVELIPSRFSLDESSIREVDLYPEATGNQRIEVEFQTQKELNEFALENGMIGFYNADFTAKGGEEFWAIFTQVFRDLDGPVTVFERFGNPETAVIDDAQRVDSAEVELSGARGVVAVDQYLYDDGLTTYAMRGTIVDSNAIHYVSAIVDVPPGETLDAVGQMRSVLQGLDGIHRLLFEEFLRIGGEDPPLEDEERGDEDPASEDDGEGLPGEG